MLIGMLLSVGAHDVTYLSTPITSGRAYLQLEELHISGVERKQSIDDIRTEHIDRAAAIAKQLRTAYRYVINPAEMPDIDGWTQFDYIALWLAVIDRFVKTAYFIDEWNYSRGCSQEFLACQRGAIPTLDERGKLISVERGLALVEEAVVGYDGVGLDASIHRQVLADLQSL